MTNILVTGGAGYIGSHACKALARAGFTPVAYDNLSTGWADAVKFGPLEVGDLADRARLDAVMATYQPAAILHFGGLSQVGESLVKPGLYWRGNVLGSLTLIEAALAAGCKALVFSSTCAIYGDQDGVVLDETSPPAPLTAYGASKHAIEEMLGHFGQSDGLRSVIFRYFNVAGADPDGEIGECHEPETHLIPRMLATLTSADAALTIHGTDYDTPDGTCIRDFVHVSDLVDAHVLGLRHLLEGRESAVFNLGTGSGFSVREVIAAAKAITNGDVPVVPGPRRPGDAVRLVSGSDRARATLGWAPQRSDIQTMIRDAWRWHNSDGYRR